MREISDFEDDIVEYLHLEFGEEAGDPEALKRKELRYVGLFLFEDFPTHFWSFPCESEHYWATVRITDEAYLYGMTPIQPSSLRQLELKEIKD